MKIGGNLVASIAASCWSAIIGLAVVPFYIRYFGIEAFGLIGFFGTLQALFYIFDLGLASTMNREIARFAATNQTEAAARLLSTLSYVYWLVALAIGVVVFVGAPTIATHWLRDSNLAPQQISTSLMLMGLVIALRWPTGLYQGVLQGGEHIMLASAISTGAITLSYLGALLIVMFVSPTLEGFFVWQALVAFLQASVTYFTAWRSLGTSPQHLFDLSELKRVWRFSAGLGVTAVLAVVLMQFDKVILSRLVPLADFGYYALAGLAPRTLYLLLTPVFTVIYPRLARLHAIGDEASIIRIYRHGTRGLLALIFPLAATVVIFGIEIFTLWTGNPHTAAIAAPVAALLIIGTAANGAMHFPYALQLAYGQSSLPARINLFLVAIFIPMVSILADRFGIIGGGAAWAITNMLYLVFGAIFTHRRILCGLASKWLMEDVAIPAIVSISIVGAAGFFLHQANAPLLLTILGGIASMMLATGITILFSPDLVREICIMRGQFKGKTSDN